MLSDEQRALIEAALGSSLTGVPEGWFTAADFMAEYGLTRNQARPRLDQLVRAGHAECAQGRHQGKIVNIYRMKAQTSK